MRIIGGSRKGLLIHPPKGLPVRPTTDRAKESFFNILDNHRYWEDLRVLDLFAGTGNMSLEFASRGCEEVWSIDIHKKCIDFIELTAQKLGFDQLHTITSDVFRFIKNEPLQPFDIIFADPPYDLPNLDKIFQTILDRNLLTDGGWFVLEHRSNFKPTNENYKFDSRIYGQSTFSFFGNKQQH